MNSLTDQQLLRDYTGRRSEAAFAELVQRHVDFVYSAALRMVRDAHLAEDVTQAVFVALAQKAPQLTDRPVLSGWLHRTAQNLAANAVRSDVRRRAREQEAAAMNESLAPEPDALSHRSETQADDWERIAPHLDAALSELSEADRDALLLRYFQRKSAREMAQTLGTSEDAAQKRVSRAVERLREFLSKHGVAVGASGLVAVLSANTVHAAPIGLVTTISTGAALSGAAIHSTTTLGLTKAIAMTTIQKALIAATITAAVGTGIYEAHRASQLQTRIQALQEQALPAEQFQQLQQDRDAAMTRLAAAQRENEQLRRDAAQLPILRGEVARLQGQAKEQAQAKLAAQTTNDPFIQTVFSMANRAAELNSRLQQMPDKRIPELQLLTENDWLDAVRNANLDTDTGVRTALSDLRRLAKGKFATMMAHALDQYVQANNGQLPMNPSDLQPYFAQPVDPSMFQRYEMLNTGQLADVPSGRGSQWIIGERAPVDDEYDSHFYIGSNGRTANVPFRSNATAEPATTGAALH